MIAAFTALTAAALAAAQPGTPSSGAPLTVQPAEGEPSQALIDRFVAVLPDANLLGRAEVNQQDVASLNALNPGRGEDVLLVSQAHARCLAPHVSAASLRLFRAIGLRLGEARLTRMIDFYTSADFPAFAQLGEKMRTPAGLTAAESIRLRDMFAAYPLEQFHQAFGTESQKMADDRLFIEASRACAAERERHAETRNIRIR